MTTTQTGSRFPEARSPEPLDFLNIDALLSDEELATREEIRSFVWERIKPNIPDWWEKAIFPREIVPEMGSLGLLGMHLKGYGCAGRSAVAYGLACMELEAGASGIRTFVSMQGSLTMSAIHKFGSEEQKQEWLPRIARGEAIGCFGLTEPEAGSDLASMESVLTYEGTSEVHTLILGGTVTGIQAFR
jgi:glutaryl-CoA dehydrogenase